MVATTYMKGYKVYYDFDKHEWFYCDDGSSAKGKPRPCKRCGQDSIIKDNLEYDYCLGNLGDNVTSACCGHGVKKGFILFEDGRLFEEVIDDE